MGFKKLEAWDMPGNPFEMIETRRRCLPPEPKSISTP